MCIDSWMTRTVPGCPRCPGWGRNCYRSCSRPSPPVPWGVTCSLSLGVLEWNGPPQAGRLWVNPPRSLGNWSHPLPLVSAWLAVDYSQRAAATLSSLDLLSDVWWSVTGCALLLIQLTKIAQKMTVSLDFRLTAVCPLSFKFIMLHFFQLLFSFLLGYGCICIFYIFNQQVIKSAKKIIKMCWKKQNISICSGAPPPYLTTSFN